MRLKYLHFRKAHVVFLIIINVCFTQLLVAQKFTLAIFPDSQYAISQKPELLTIQTQWLADKKDSLNLPFVLHVGDLVDWDTILHFERASNSFKILDDANINYAIAIGNHDTPAVNTYNGSAAPGNTRERLRMTEKFNTYFPVERFKAQQGRYEEGKSDNSYHTFEAGGLKWLVMVLEMCARNQMISWANSVIPNYPDHNVIFLTHVHLNSSGQVDPTNSGYGDNSPNTIFFNLMRKHANVRFVFCGHYSSARSKHRVDPGEKGNKIYQMLQDYATDNQGNAYLRLLDIDVAAGTIEAKMYSPYLNTTRNDFSKFTYTGVEFVQPGGVGTGDNLIIPAKSFELKILSDSSAGNLFAELFSIADSEVTLTLTSISGQELSSLKLKIPSHTESKIDMNKLGVSSLTPGIYLLNAHQGNNATSQKFVIQ
jgi:hypothetical protein